MHEQRLRRLQAAAWSLQHGWDDGRAGDLIAEVSDLVAEIRALRRDLKEARTWAWSEHHQSFSDRWLGPRSPKDGQRVLPDWLRYPYEPYRQPWWDDTTTHDSPVTGPGVSTGRDPADVVADAVRWLGRVGVIEDPGRVRDEALAALERLRRQRDDADGEAQHWHDMYTARLTAERTEQQPAPPPGGATGGETASGSGARDGGER